MFNKILKIFFIVIFSAKKMKNIYLTEAIQFLFSTFLIKSRSCNLSGSVFS